MAVTVCRKGHVTVTSKSYGVSAQGKSYGVGVQSVVRSGKAYEGAYEVTPSATEQVLPTEGRVMQRDVVIAPIPSNYGLITWDGSVLTVS